MLLDFSLFNYQLQDDKIFYIPIEKITYDESKKPYIENPDDRLNKEKAKQYLIKKLKLNSIDSDFIEILSLAYLNRQFLPTEKQLRQQLKKLKKKNLK